jgi:hypothetical protein
MMRGRQRSGNPARPSLVLSVKQSAFGRSSIPRSSLCQALCGKNRRRRVLPASSWELELRRVPRSPLETHAATPNAPSGKHPAVRDESSAPSLATFRPRTTPQSKKHCAERGKTPHTIRPNPPLRTTKALKTRALKPLVPVELPKREKPAISLGKRGFSGVSTEWAMRGSNPRHPPCKGGALAN